MALYAYVENGEVKQVEGELPGSWKNVSNFFAIKDENLLNQYGWFKVILDDQLYDSSTHILGDPTYSFKDGAVIQHRELLPRPPDQVYQPLTLDQLQFQTINNQWESIKTQRDQLMRDFEWRYNRYEREIRMGVEPIDDIVRLDRYMQALADITKQSDPFNIVWPRWPI